jgi:hypothetical protein
MTPRKNLIGSVSASAGINKIDLKTRYFSFVKKSLRHRLMVTLVAGRYSRWRSQTVGEADDESIGSTIWVGNVSAQKTWLGLQRSFALDRV